MNNKSIPTFDPNEGLEAIKNDDHRKLQIMQKVIQSHNDDKYNELEEKLIKKLEKDDYLIEIYGEITKELYRSIHIFSRKTEEMLRTSSPSVHGYQWLYEAWRKDYLKKSLFGRN